MKKYFSIFLILSVALSSVGMSVSQHFCTMSKEEIEADACNMCSSEDHGAENGDSSDKKSCCSQESVHLRVDTDATNSKIPEAPQPLISTPLFAVLLQSETSSDQLDLVQAVDQAIPPFPLAEEHTVLRV